MRILFLLMISFLVSCDFFSLMNAGTHGSLGAYSYDASKDSVEKKIEFLINKSENIIKLKTDGDIYLKILIITSDSCYFVFRFYGDEEFWTSHPNNSELFITAVRKGNDIYKSEGEIKDKDRDELLKVFEKNFAIPLT